jgi:hypothetical protein
MPLVPSCRVVLCLLAAVLGPRASAEDEHLWYLTWTEWSQGLTQDARFGEAFELESESMAVGAPGEPGNASESGGLYFCRAAGTNWVYVERLVASDNQGGERLGSSVGLHADAVVAGAPTGLGSSGPSGAAYVFRRTAPDAWIEEAKLTPAGPGGTKEFGAAVDVWGDTVVIGAPGDGGERGAVFVFTHSGGTRSQTAKLVAADAAGGARFGASLSLHEGSLAVGAPGDSEAAAGAGAVYVFSETGSTWTRRQKLLSGDTDADDSFGTSVAIQPPRLIAGQPGDDGAGTDIGAAYVFVQQAGAWSASRSPWPTRPASRGPRCRSRASRTCSQASCGTTSGGTATPR